MERVLVAGGAGFIGSHLCGELISRGYKVVCVDNLITGDLRNISHLKKHENFEFIKADITHPSEVLSESNVDYVFHLASPASPVDYQEHPFETAMSNSSGTLNLLELALESEARFLFASTSEVYGDPLVHPQKEEYWGNVNPVGPRSCYDESKRFGEMISMLYHRKYGVDVRIARIFNTYGPRMRRNDGRVIPNFITQALANQPITVYGDGTQTRSFCYVSDMVEGLIRLMFADNAAGKIVNLGNPDERRVVDVARLVREIVGSRSEIVYFPLPKDDPKVRKPDISKAKTLLSWGPKVCFEEGLTNTINFFKQNE